MTIKLIKTLAIAAVAGCFASSTVFALPITGEITFLGSVKLDTNSLATATKVETFYAGPNANRMLVDLTSGDFSSISYGTLATFTSDWVFGAAATPLWTVGSFTFDLLTSVVVFQDATFLNISGTGIVSGAGFEPTVMAWTFTSSSTTPTANRFSVTAATSSVPDGGATAALLGAAILGLFFVRQRFSSSNA